LIAVLIQERDYLREQVSALQARINELQSHVIDANDRLLVREGAHRKMEPAERPTIDPTLHETDAEWEARRTAEEVDEHARRAMSDPLFCQMVEEAADFDPAWARVKERMEQLR